jgi:hypothetical protein
MFGNDYQKQIDKLQERLDFVLDKHNGLYQKIGKLEYQLNNPAKYLVGQKLFKRYTICEVNLAYESEYPCGYYRWRYKAFDSTLNMVVTMRLDCGGNIIEEKVCKG